jgi:Uma2 family endonuclease
MAKILTSEYSLDLIAPQLENMTDDEFFDFCGQNKHTHIERDENHQIIFMPPGGIHTSAMNVTIASKLFNWNSGKNIGIVFGSSAGFYLPDTSMKSPDAAWMSREKWESLSSEEQSKFAHVCPEFVVELMSPSDDQKLARLKIKKWIENGVQLGWLIDPKLKETFIYRADGTIEKVQGFTTKLSGEHVLPGFELDLSALT